MKCIVKLNSQSVTHMQSFKEICDMVQNGYEDLRPGSDADLFMSRTQFEFGPTQINQSTPVDSDAELN